MSHCPICLRTAAEAGWCWRCRPEPPEGDALPWLWVLGVVLVSCWAAVECGLGGGL